MDAFSIAISIGLQYGVPLEAYVSKFINTKFDPSGITNDPDIRFATSLVDYVFRRLALDHLPTDKRLELGIKSVDERKAEATTNGNVNGGHGDDHGGSRAEVSAPPAAPEATELPIVATPPASQRAVDAPLCYTCGSKMQAAGSCYVCTSCGSTSGCS
jgi:ribonucleoside-diphosphate reductase alpha chain